MASPPSRHLVYNVTHPLAGRAGIGLADRFHDHMATDRFRSDSPSGTSPAAQAASKLEAQDVRAAARKFRENPDPRHWGFGPSIHYDVWIDLGDGRRPYPPKVICALAAKRVSRELGPGFKGSLDGYWVPRLDKLGFPVLAKSKRPGPRVSCRGVDLDAGSSTKDAAAGSAARALPHVAAYKALVAEHFRAAAQKHLDGALQHHADSYTLWIDGSPYPFWPLFRAAVKATGGSAPQRRHLRKGYQPEHERVQALDFDVLPRGIPPVPNAGGIRTAPSPAAISVAALKCAAELLELAPEFRDRREGRKSDLWVEGNGPYPVKAMCLLAWHSLGLGWHEHGKTGGPATNKHLQSLPGVEILPKDSSPDADGGRSRAEADDIRDIARRVKDATTRKRLVDARIGQGDFRQDLERHWGKACAVTGVSLRQVLRASHIKPWKTSNDVERLDPHNGLLLVANLDCLFDRGLISFANNGALLISEALPQKQIAALGLREWRGLRSDGPRHLTDERLRFLETHRARYGYPE